MHPLIKLQSIMSYYKNLDLASSINFRFGYEQYVILAEYNKEKIKIIIQSKSDEEEELFIYLFLKCNIFIQAKKIIELADLIQGKYFLLPAIAYEEQFFNRLSYLIEYFSINEDKASFHIISSLIYTMSKIIKK